MQLLRILAFNIFFFGIGFFMHGGQLLGMPIYFISKPHYYAWQSLMKANFGLLITKMTQLFSPTTIRISGDRSVTGLLHQRAGDGMLQVDFGERVVLMANHQIYTDWIYLWWIAYTNSVPAHGDVYIILKESLKFVPVIGPAMMFFSFIFMKRKWSTDQLRLRYRLRKLTEPVSEPAKLERRPMWLMIFPEGTNLSAFTRQGSAAFATKTGIEDMKRQLLPRTTGLQFCLQELRDSVPYLYDCTIAYEGTPASTGYAAEKYTLRSIYFQGLPPKSVNMHWRRFATASIPVNDAEAMQEWLLERWREKDALLETFFRTGRFPAEVEAVEIEGAPREKGFRAKYICTEVMPRTSWEFFGIFVPCVVVGTVAWGLVGWIDRTFGKAALFGSEKWFGS